MPRGRPVKSNVRQNIIEILYFMKKGYGYDIAKHYNRIFPKVSMRLIYYHLKKGVELGEFKLESVEKEKGNYSWGEEVEKKYYGLGENAAARGDEKVKEHFRKKESP